MIISKMPKTFNKTMYLNLKKFLKKKTKMSTPTIYIQQYCGGSRQCSKGNIKK